MATNKTGKDIMNATVIMLSVIVMVVIGALIISTITTNSVFTDIPSSGSVTNETGAYINSTGYTLAQASIGGFASPVITAVYNVSDNATILSGNYTVSSAGVLTNATTTEWSDVLVSYTYNYASGTSLAGLNVTEIGEDFGDFVTNLIAFLAVIGTIIGVIWLVLYVRRLLDKKEGLQKITS